MLKRLLAAALLFGSACLAGPAAAVEREVTFQGADGVPLAGTLNVPDGAGRHPALLLIQGSGPTDRNGNNPLVPVRIDLLKQLADMLAAEGIATLRYDKRGMFANKATMPTDPAALPNFTRWDAFVEDAAGAFRFLAEQQAVDPARIGIAGHSEGGLVALDLTARGTVRPKVLILLSTPGRPLAAVIEEQLERTLEAQNAPPDVAADLLGASRRISDEIIRTGRVPDHVPAGLKALYPDYAGPFLQSLLRFDPAQAAAGLDMPVLVLTGKADAQVSVERDAAALARPVAKLPGSQVTVPEGVSHNLKSVEENGPGFEGAVAPEVLEKLKEWLAEHL